MDTQEILSKIAKLKKAVESESDADVKASYNKKIAALEAQVADAEAKVDKKEEKAAAEEKKTLSEADEKIKKLEKALASESDPDVKARYQKKLNELKGTLKDVKEEIKEEKKEIAEQKKEIKQAVKEVKSVQKEVRKTAIKKVAAKKVERKKVETKKTKRKEKLNRVLSDLDALIEKNKKLKSKYGSGYKGTGKPTDLERDAGRKAKPFGYRFVGKHDYRVPTETQIKRGLKRGTIDYEARPNRADVNPSKKVKLAHGGEVQKINMGNGVFLDLEDAIKMYEDKIKSQGRVVNERDEDMLKQLKRMRNNYASGGMMAADTMMRRGGRTKAAIVADKRYKALKAGKRVSEDGNVYYESRANRSDVSRRDKLEDGGMMARGGMLNNDLKFDLQKIKGYDYLEINKDEIYPDGEEMYTIEVNDNTYFYHNKKDRDKDYDKLKSYVSSKMMDGGMMARGGSPNTPKSIAKMLYNKYDQKQRQEFLQAAGYSESVSKDLSGESWESLESGVHKNLSEVLHAGRKKRADGGMMKRGGKVGKSKEDRARYAKPAGWRWKDEAVTKRIIERKQLSMQPSKKMREKYPDLVYYEDRLNKADKKPTRTSADSI